MDKLMELILPSIISFVVHSRENLTKKEKSVQERLLKNLRVDKSLGHKPVIIAFVGLVSSGKSFVAKALASLIGATILEGDKIRVELRKEGERYEGTRKISENLAIEIVQRGGSVILDSDHVDQKKRASLIAKARKEKVQVLFVRTYTGNGITNIPGTNLDEMIGRGLEASYQNTPDDFFGGASTSWKGSAQKRGVVVKIREMLRRLPHHYRWINNGGGEWKLKTLPFVPFVEINTSGKDLRSEIEKCAEKIRLL